MRYAGSVMAKCKSETTASIWKRPYVLSRSPAIAGCVLSRAGGATSDAVNILYRWGLAEIAAEEAVPPFPRQTGQHAVSRQEWFCESGVFRVYHRRRDRRHDQRAAGCGLDEFRARAPAQTRCNLFPARGQTSSPVRGRAAQVSPSPEVRDRCHPASDDRGTRRGHRRSLSSRAPYVPAHRPA